MPDTPPTTNFTSTNTLIYAWGPPTIDWLNIASADEAGDGATYWPISNKQAEVHLTAQTGGTALLQLLLKEMCPAEKANVVGTVGSKAVLDTKILLEGTGGDLGASEWEAKRVNPFLRNVKHNWTLWKKYPLTSARTDGRKNEDTVYRMLGWSDREAGSSFEDDYKGYYEPAGGVAYPVFKNWLYLLDDPGWNVKDVEGEDVESKIKACYENLMGILTTTIPLNTHIVLRLAMENSARSSVYADSALYNLIKDTPNLAEKTTILTSLRNLRGEVARVGVSLSWEQMFDDVVDAIETVFNGKFARVVVVIEQCGAVIVQKQGDATKKILVFDRMMQENDFQQKYPGFVLGYSTSIMAALATAWTEQNGNPNWSRAIANGLCMARTLHKSGYKVSTDPQRPILQFPLEEARKTYFGCPVPKRWKDELWDSTPREREKRAQTPEEKADEYIKNADFREYAVDMKRFSADDLNRNVSIFPNCKAEEEKYRKLKIVEEYTKEEYTRQLGRQSQSANTTWSILRCKLPTQNASYGFHPYEEIFNIGKDVVEKGPTRALADIPIEKVGRWQSIDRHEIEGVRSVSNAMRAYIADWQKQKRPLSIAVFGPPGSGKSFVVREIAQSLNIGKKAQLTFNLSEYETSKQLAGAFQQIRDLQLEGEKPLVFWDEFDSRLGPNRLGWLRYFLVPMQDGQFSDDGQTHHIGPAIYVFAGGTCHNFKDFRHTENDEERNAKKPDFVSRLRAFIDVKGTQGGSEDSGGLYIIRRALLVHAALDSMDKKIDNMRSKDKKGLKAKEGFQVEDGVLRALLQTTKYEHGARSLEAILQLCDLDNKSKFELSSLPSKYLLQMHVDADDFMTLATQSRNSVQTPGGA